MKNFVFCDIDGVVRDFTSVADARYKKGGRFRLIDASQWDLDKRYPLWGKRAHDILLKNLAEDCFVNALPYPDAVDTVLQLHAQAFRFVFITRQSPNNGRLTAGWLSKMGLGNIDCLYVFPNGQTKGQRIAEELMRYGSCEGLVTVLIDDSPEELESARDVVKLLACINRPYNQNITFPVQRFASLKAFAEAYYIE